MDGKSDPKARTAAVKRSARKKQAGGLPAITSTLHHLRRESGLVRGTRALLRMNQSEGFDCPGCAWPEPKERTSFEFCENGAKALAEEATRKRASPEVFARHSLAELREMSDFALGQLGRISAPLLFDSAREGTGTGHYRAIAWQEAFDLIGTALRGLDSPDQAVFYTSGRTSNEAAFLYQLFGRMLGTNNFPDCSNMCHESSGVGMSEVIGVGKGTVDLDDFARADAIFVIGQNPGTNHPRMLTTLREAAKRGCRIVSINPLPEPGLSRFAHPQKVGDIIRGGVPLASLVLPVRIGADVALLKGIAKAVIEAEERQPGSVLDHAFITAHTDGFAEFQRDLKNTSWDLITEQSGIGIHDIRAAAQIYLEAKNVICCWAMGITQHKNAVDNVQEIVNLLLLRGNLGRPGAGACPVRGHSNVQGDRTMGITPRPKAAFLDRLGHVFDFEPPRQRGMDTVEAIAAMHEGQVSVFCAMGGNLVSAAPDTAVTAAALEKCALTVHVSTKVNRSHLYPGTRSLILPVLGRSERDRQPSGLQFVTVEDSMSVVHTSQGHLQPASAELRSEPAVVAAIARATFGAESKVSWYPMATNYDLIRDKIAQVVEGCNDYNRRVRQKDGFRLPNGARNRDFASVGGKARFVVHDIPDLNLPAGRLRMMTIRSHDQYNTTIYGLDDRYRGIHQERRVVLLNGQDMADLGLEEHQVVDLISEFQGIDRVAAGFIAIRYQLPRGSAATYFPEANVLVPLKSTADKSNTPTSKSVVIRVVPAGA